MNERGTLSYCVLFTELPSVIPRAVVVHYDKNKGLAVMICLLCDIMTRILIFLDYSGSALAGPYHGKAGLGYTLTVMAFYSLWAN